MPELPDITLYCSALSARLVGERLLGVAIRGPSLLKSVAPSPSECVDRRIVGIERIGKRVVLAHEGDLFSVLHLMIAGRLHWKKPGAATGAPLTELEEKLRK